MTNDYCNTYQAFFSIRKCRTNYKYYATHVQIMSSIEIAAASNDDNEVTYDTTTTTTTTTFSSTRTTTTTTTTAKDEDKYNNQVTNITNIIFQYTYCINYTAYCPKE